MVQKGIKGHNMENPNGGFQISTGSLHKEGTLTFHKRFTSRKNGVIINIMLLAGIQ